MVAEYPNPFDIGEEYQDHSEYNRLGDPDPDMADMSPQYQAHRCKRHIAQALASQLCR